MKIVKNGKGTQFTDRVLAGNVRGLALKHLEKILSPSYKDKKFQKEIISRLAPTLLPRLNELTGEGGQPLLVKFDGQFK